MTIILTILLAWLFADLLSGIFHWWEDRYGNPDWPIIGKLIIQPNIEHHKDPKKFTRGNYFKRNYTTIIPSLILALLSYSYNCYFLCLTFIFASQSNEIHCWEHCRPNFAVRFLQKYKILQSAKEHSIHHKRPYDQNYCVMSVVLNPVLSYLGFWYFIENCIALFGIVPNPERQNF
jgi:ubiquitin-conjugating enzyme E2 variant